MDSNINATAIYADNEAGVMRLLREFLQYGRLATLFDLPEVARFEEEFSLPRGRVDFLAFHADASLTIIEAKGPGDLRTILGGIGQLLSYRLQLGMAQPGARIRCILFAPIEPATEEARLVHFACESAGITFEPVPSAQTLNRQALETLRRLELI